MNTIESTTQGWANEPQPKKSKTWIWVLVGVLVLCLCLVALGVGIYIYLTLRPAQVVTSAPGGSDYPPAPTMAPLATQFPTPSEVASPPTSVVVETHYPGDPYDYSILELNPLYDWSATPGVMTWDASIKFDDSVLLEQGWCTASQEILEQNFEHIQLIFEVDDELIDLDTFYQYDWLDGELFCRSYLGIVQAWPVGDHVVIIEMRLDAAINDGWDDYAAGQYIDQFIISATP